MKTDAAFRAWVRRFVDKKYRIDPDTVRKLLDDLEELISENGRLRDLLAIKLGPDPNSPHCGAS